MIKKIAKLGTIKGAGFITIVIVLAETNCFEHVTSAKQLACYAGLDVVFNDSGERKRKTTISKSEISLLGRLSSCLLSLLPSTITI